jgi:hypothetical protein
MGGARCVRFPLRRYGACNVHGTEDQTQHPSVRLPLWHTATAFPVATSTAARPETAQAGLVRGSPRSCRSSEGPMGQRKTHRERASDTTCQKPFVVEL